MMRSLALTVSIICLAFGLATAQDKYRTDKGEINFNASTPLEDIRAVNNEVNAILDAYTGKFAAVMLIRDFEFKRKLMQEHFNENYMESDKFPKAYFSGTITNLDLDRMSSGEESREISGSMTIHGVERPFKARVGIKKNKDQIYLKSNFIIRPEDHNIEVPRIVFKKIAQEVDVAVLFKLFLQ